MKQEILRIQKKLDVISAEIEDIKRDHIYRLKADVSSISLEIENINHIVTTLQADINQVWIDWQEGEAYA